MVCFILKLVKNVKDQRLGEMREVTPEEGITTILYKILF